MKHSKFENAGGLENLTLFTRKKGILKSRVKNANNTTTRHTMAHKSEKKQKNKSILLNTKTAYRAAQTTIEERQKSPNFSQFRQKKNRPNIGRWHLLY